MWRGYGFLDRLDCILRFKKNLEITDETCKMERHKWKATAGIYTYADAPTASHVSGGKVGAGMQLECPASSSADRKSGASKQSQAHFVV